MKAVGIVSLLLVLSGCVTTRGPASEAETKAAMSRMMDCIAKNVDELDDGKADPVKLAHVIVNDRCPKELAASIELAQREVPADEREDFKEHIPKGYYVAAEILMKARP